MNEVQRINALNEWFLGECHAKSASLVHEVMKEWDKIEGYLPMLGVWLEQRIMEKWLEWVRSN